MATGTKDDGSNLLSRRDFLKTAALGVAAASLGRLAFPSTARAAQPVAGIAQAAATVIDTRSPKWRVNGQIDAAYIKTMIDYGVRRLMDRQNPAEAWGRIAKPTDVVGIKFNGLSRDYTGANQAVLDALVAGLAAAGVQKDKILVAEGVGTNWKNAVRPNTKEYGMPVELMPDVEPGKRARLTKFVTEQIDVLINVPNIKDHGSAGVTGCLKNLSHSKSIMDGPGPWHGRSCWPGIVGINKLMPLRNKLKLNVINGLLAVYNGGPGTGRKDQQWEHNGFLFAVDPVACDRVEIEIIEAERKRRGLRGLFERGSKPIHVEKAAEAGIGVADLAKINWIKVEDA